MKNNIFKNSVIPMLLVCILMLLTSQVVVAAKPVKEAPTPPPPVIIIDSVIVDYSSSKIVVTGEGFNDVTEAILGGESILADLNDVTDTNTLLEFDFSTNMVGAVPTTPGNYSLELNGNAFSVYFSSAVFDPSTTASCPCQAEWESFGTALPPNGFSGVPATCNYDSGDFVEVQFWNFDNNQIWILNTKYNTTGTKACALVIDGNTYPLTPQQHDACSNYLITQYFDPSVTNAWCL